ncbi:MAG: FtsK/SpoIIIE domain-containing protein [Pirellulales bacterium]
MEMNSDKPPADAPDPRAQEAQFLAELTRLAAERAATEEAIDSQHRAAKNAAERSLHDERQHLARDLEQAKADAAEDFDEQCRHATARFEYDTAQVEQAFVELQRRVTAACKKHRKSARRDLKEARWEAETMFEATQDLAPRQLKEFRLALQARLAGLAIERDAARNLLTDWHARWAIAPADSRPPTISGTDFLERLGERIDFVVEQRMALNRLRMAPLAARYAPLWVFVAVGAATVALGLYASWSTTAIAVSLAAALAAGIASSIAFLRFAGRQVSRIYRPLCEAACDAEAAAASALDDARAKTAARQAEVVEHRRCALAGAKETYQSRIAAITAQRDKRLQGPAVAYPERLGAIAARRDGDLELAEITRRRHGGEIARREAALAACDARFARQFAQINQRHEAQCQKLVEKCQSDLARMQSRAGEIRGNGDAEHRYWRDDWPAPASGDWSPAATIPPAIRIGKLRVDLGGARSGALPDGPLSRLVPTDFELPAFLPFPGRTSLFVKARADGRRVAVEAMQAMMLRLLMAVPPGKLRFLIIDPVGLGDNFAAFMHLADDNEALVTSRIWTEPRHIEERLADLSEHMENVIQKYLRNEFASIAEYNRDAGEIAEPYRFLVIADFPANFTEAAQRRLISIAASGARCGVYTLVMTDTQMPPAAGVSLADLEQHAATLNWTGERFAWTDEQFGRFPLALDARPPAAQFTEILRAAGKYAAESGRVEVPFEAIAPAPDHRWTSSARFGIDVPLGRVGATRLQSLRLGQGTSQHVLVAGKTGSGKSTLLHALVTNLALRYRPDEVELYLVDFKQGVEFKTYAGRLPHARVVAIESDREFGLSVLGRVDEELKTRADAFRAAGVQDLAAFRQAEPGRPIPRILLVVDEFQEFFVEDDKLSQDAALLLDRLVRQGRAFGIHVLLGSQTLAGTYTLSRSTIGQMAVRIALQCSETDAHLILSEENSAARLLSRAGEAIYNDSNGLVEGNHPFQVVWLGDEKRETYLAQVRELAGRDGHTSRPQVVFEGNAPAEIERNALLADLLDAAQAFEPVAAARAWLGEAVSIKEPTAVTFRRQSGSNLLVVGQNEQSALAILASSLVSLAAQQPPGSSDGARFYILDGSAAGTNERDALARLAEIAGDSSRLVAHRELSAAAGELAEEVQRRHDETGTKHPPLYVLVYGLQRLRDLRRGEDDFAFSRAGEHRGADPAGQFADVLRDGPTVGVHAVVWCDSVNNLHRTWDRQTLREFEMRVVFQMSGNDSSTLIDTPLAAKLGAHRALFHSDEQGVLEKFRPYRWPSDEWLQTVRAQLQRTGGESDNRAQKVAV